MQTVPAGYNCPCGVEHAFKDQRPIALRQVRANTTRCKVPRHARKPNAQRLRGHASDIGNRCRHHRKRSGDRTKIGNRDRAGLYYQFLGIRSCIKDNIDRRSINIDRRGYHLLHPVDAHAGVGVHCQAIKAVKRALAAGLKGKAHSAHIILRNIQTQLAVTQRHAAKIGRDLVKANQKGRVRASAGFFNRKVAAKCAKAVNTNVHASAAKGQVGAIKASPYCAAKRQIRNARYRDVARQGAGFLCRRQDQSPGAARQ